ncbi:MAG: recombinase family protein [Anaeromassilibacillus sp.]
MQEQYSVGIYARLSRDDERAGESVSIENQKEMLARYVREQGWTLYDYYCDDGVSGTTFTGPGFNRLAGRDRPQDQFGTNQRPQVGLAVITSRRANIPTSFSVPWCRFIALNDGVDTIRKNNEMLVILKNVMNDLYADTSNKIGRVKLSTFKAGKYMAAMRLSATGRARRTSTSWRSTR